jgi:glycerophosphoryl diester phosphodiesterase
VGGGARGIAPDRLWRWDARGRARGLVAAAHAAGLEVHAWTFRDDADAFPFTDPAAALGAAFALGVDAVFCDFPDTAVAIRAASA